MSPPNPTAHSRSVRAELRAAEVSQEKIAAVLGLTQPAVSRRLRGVTPWRADELVKIAEAFRIPLARLYTINTDLTVPAAQSDGEPSVAAS